MQVIEVLVPLSKLVDDKLLKSNNISYIKQRLDLIEHQDTQLIGNAAVAELLHDDEHGLDSLAAHQRCHVLA